MAQGYLSIIAALLGIPIWFLVIAIVWSAVWKFIALWKSARNDSLVWFIVLGVVNTVGILEILYIFVFSKMEKKSPSKKPVKKSARKKTAKGRR